MALNFGSAASGAIAGGSLGSMFPVVGTGIGAAIGGIAGLFGGGKKKKKKYSTFDSKQKGLYDQYVQGLQGQGPQAGLYNFNANQANNVFDQNVARPELRNWEENVIPKITGQFRQGNIQNSSYTGEALARSGRNVQENLSGLRSSLQFQGQEAANQRRFQGTQNALDMPTFQYGGAEDSQIDQILNTVAPSAGEWFKDFLKSKSGSNNSLAGAKGYGG